MGKKNEFPFSLEDRTGCLTYPIIAVEASFESVRVVYRQMFGADAPKLVDHTILRAHIAESREASQKQNTIYYAPPASENPLRTHIANLRRMCLEQGATPEAIRLIGSLEPWTKKEEAIMAEKLKSKASASKPDKAGLKSAAKSTPVGGNKKGKGNADALAKARAAKGPDTRKIKVLNKKPAAREGSYRARMLKDLLASKTVAEFRGKDSAYSAGDVAYAIKAGIISAA